MLGALGILLGASVIIYLSLKRLNIMITAPLAALVVIIFNRMPIYESLLGPQEYSFISALGENMMKFFALFLLGSILGKLMERSGATLSIAQGILRRIGYDKPYAGLLALFLICSILTFGGISMYVVLFAVIPLGRSLFKEMNISWSLIQLPIWLGVATLTLVMLPGSPSIQNVIPVTYLGTSINAAPLPSILGAIASTIFGLWFMHYRLQQSLQKGEVFEEEVDLTATPVDAPIKTLPSLGCSLLPLLLLITVAIGGSMLGNDQVKGTIIYVALLSAIVVSLVLFWPYLDNPIETLFLGATDSTGALFATVSAVAFGSVIVHSPGFDVIVNKIYAINDNPYFKLISLNGIMSLITSSSVGTLSIILPKFSQELLQSGANPELLHRIACLSVSVFPMGPHSGAVLTFLGLTGLNYKTGYKDSVIVVAICTGLALVVTLMTGLWLY